MNIFNGNDPIINIYLGTTLIVGSDNNGNNGNIFIPSNIVRGRYVDPSSVSTVCIKPAYTRTGNGINIINPMSRNIIILSMDTIDGYSTATQLYNTKENNITYMFDNDNVLYFGIEFKRDNSREDNLNETFNNLQNNIDGIVITEI